MKTSVRYSIATVCIVGLIATWLAMAELLQSLQENYPKPFFLTYVVHCGYSFFLLVWLVWRYLPCQGCQHTNYLGPFKWNDYIALSIWMSFLAFGAAYFWYISLSKTSVSGNTAVFQSQSAFVFVLSAIVLKEKVTPLKVGSVVLCVAGVLLVALFPGADEHSNTSSKKEIDPSASGYIFCAVGMMMYVVYEVVYKKKAYRPDDPVPLTNALRILGLIGINTLVCYWPIFLILDGTGIEKFELPTGSNLRLTIINVVLDGTYNCLLLIGMAVSSPLFITVCLLLTLPATVPADYLLHDHYTLPPAAYGGVALITVGFLGFCWAEYRATKMPQAAMGPKELEESGECCDGATEPLLDSSNSD